MAIYIADEQELEQKINAMREEFHVIADFDKTLTKAKVDGAKVHSTYSVIRDHNYLGKEFSKREFALFEKYYPFEIDHTLDIKTKCKWMQEWWAQHWQLFVNAKMSLEILEKIIANFHLQLRQGAHEFFEQLEKNNIPLLIFSAGVGDVIRLFLEHQQKITKNVHLISNFLEFNKEGIAIAHSKPLIHTFNKNEHVLKDTPYYNEVKDKKSVILLGDSLGDVNMAKGMEHDVVLKIGFLNGKQELLELYTENFDIVIDEEGMEWVNELIHQLCES